MEEKAIKLVQKSGTYNYKLVIPAAVERKIRFICQKVWNTEWSGTLFIKHEGSFENNDLVITCVDIFVMDIGSATYTEFDMSPDVIAYMAENPELLDCNTALIHSHNHMPSFFSGTDQQTLKEEGRDRNNFVSLIVNNEGSYTAAITRRVRSKKIMESVSYTFFDEGDKHEVEEYENETDEIEWFYLDIVKEDTSSNFEDVSARLEEIKKIKEEKDKSKTIIHSFANPNIQPYANRQPITEGTLFKDEESNDLTFINKDFKGNPFQYGELDVPYGQVFFNRKTIRTLVIQIITGSIIISEDSKIDIDKWVKSMPSLYKRRFGAGEEGMKSFIAWAETYTEYLTWYAHDEELERQGFDETEICAICAYDIIEELKKLPSNEYIDGYINSLQKYLTV